MKVSLLGELSVVFSSLSRNLLARPHQPSIPLSSCAHWFRFFLAPGFYPVSLTDWSQHENTPFLLICFHPANRLCTIYTFNFVVDANFYVYVMLSPSLPLPHLAPPLVSCKENSNEVSTYFALRWKKGESRDKAARHSFSTPNECLVTGRGKEACKEANNTCCYTQLLARR